MQPQVDVSEAAVALTPTQTTAPATAAAAARPESADVLTAAAAAPRPPAPPPGIAADAPSTSGRALDAGVVGAALWETAVDVATGRGAAAVPHGRSARVTALPHKDYGTLRGGQYPFAFDPVYGLPVVHDVARYAEVLRDIRQGLVTEVLWFYEPGAMDNFACDGRCLVRYTDGHVRQSVVPLSDARVPYAMSVHGVKVCCCVTVRTLADTLSIRTVCALAPAAGWLGARTHTAPDNTPQLLQ